jgi:hypothetical protein
MKTGTSLARVRAGLGRAVAAQRATACSHIFVRLSSLMSCSRLSIPDLQNGLGSRTDETQPGLIHALHRAW